MKVVQFNNITALQAFLIAEGIVLAKIASVYFDGASGHHVLVYST